MASMSPPARRPAPGRRPGRRPRGRGGRARCRTRSAPSSRGDRTGTAARSGRPPCGRARRRSRGPRAGGGRRSTMPPPMPVPRVTSTTWLSPLPAPATTSAQAAQLASLSTTTGRPSGLGQRAADGGTDPAVEVRGRPQGAVEVDQPGQARRRPRRPAPRPLASTSSSTWRRRVDQGGHDVGPPCGGRHAVRHQDRGGVGGVDDRGEHLGAPDVEADGEGHLRRAQ